MALLISILFALSMIFFSYVLLSKPAPVIDKLNAYDEISQRESLYSVGNKGTIKMLAAYLPKSLYTSNRKMKQTFLLKQAEIPFTVEEFLIIRLILWIGVPFLVYALFQNRLVTFITFAAVELTIRVILSIRRSRKIKAFDTQLNEGIVLISNALKAGYSFLQALAVASKEMEDPLSKEFKQMLKEMSLGMSIEDALFGLSMRTPSEDLKLLVNAILIQKDIGGNLSEILENIAETIRDRQKIKNEVKTLTAQGRLSGGIIMVIPIFLGGVIYLFNPGYISILFTTELGRIMIGIAVMNQFIGWLFIRKIIDIEL